MQSLYLASRGFPTVFKLGPGSVELGKLTRNLFKLGKLQKPGTYIRPCKNILVLVEDQPMAEFYMPTEISEKFGRLNLFYDVTIDIYRF